MSQYFLCQIRDVPSVGEDLLTEICFRFGAEGVSENLSFTQPNLEYLAEVIPTELIHLDAYFTTQPSAELVEEIKLHFPLSKVVIQSEQNKDWMAEWKKGFRAFELVNGIWIVPSWLSAPAEAKSILRIDPGMAFGTGTHATTQLASELVFEVIQQNQIASVIDVGTGTGVLALLAGQLGVPHIVATDNDPEAVRVAQENAQLNNQKFPITDTDVSELTESADLVLANIIDGVLLKLQNDLFRLSQKFLIVSGVLNERAEQFVQNFGAMNAFKLVSQKSRDGWNAYLYQRSSH